MEIPTNQVEEISLHEFLLSHRPLGLLVLPCPVTNLELVSAGPLFPMKTGSFLSKVIQMVVAQLRVTLLLYILSRSSG